ncbi:hypothetical protein CUJ84_Chr001972 [Rhizobium leguminosarum]|uniref:Uncharacterized protein n=1 Tax=Rhizobium leguminosarum TaxID=384 RepID=A0A2K9Z268_RHILE|nr:hypothetical protein CUJ84_Chr001972 [Rhizobium leguminosarum]
MVTMMLQRISVFIWAARGRMRPSGGHLLIALGAMATGVDAALHIAGPFAVPGKVGADFGAFPASNRLRSFGNRAMRKH